MRVKNVKTATSSAVMLLCAGPLFAQISPAQRARIDTFFADFDKPTTPGCILGIGQNGKTLYERAYGMANLEYDVPLTPSSISESGSVAKQFTASAILLLAQRGVLSLDDDIRKWLPEVPDFGGRKITIRMLANHTSGLRDQWGLLALRNNPPGSAVHSLDVILDLVSRQRDLNFNPNDEYLYSNTGYTLLAIIVQRASGKSLAQFSRENIFEPLGMTHTQWRDDFTRIVKGRATAYSGRDVFRQEMPFTNVYGNGGLLTTVGDLLIFWDALLDNRLGAPGFTKQLTTSATLNGGQTIGYALGIANGSYRGLPNYSHSGATAGYRTNVAVYPDTKTTTAILCNSAIANPVALTDSIADVLFGERLKAASPAPITPTGMTRGELRAIAGMYRNVNTNEVVRIQAHDDRLTANNLQLIPIASGRFRTSPGDNEVALQRNGDASELLVTLRDAPAVRLARVDSVAPDERALAEYAGSYWSPELEVRYDVIVNSGRLVLKRRLMPDLTLNPTFKDAFAAGGSWIFTRDGAGNVTGFTFSQGRVRHVRFDRMKDD